MSVAHNFVDLARGGGARNPPERTADNFEVERLLVGAGHHYALHYHSRDQLSWMGSGAMRVTLPGTTLLLRRDHLLWIPAGVLHEMTIVDEGELVNLYAGEQFRPSGGRWQRAHALDASDLALDLLWHLLEGGRSPRRVTLCHELLVDVLADSEARQDVVAEPLDVRAREVARILLADPADDRELSVFATDLGVSDRTLSRAFVAGTGLTFRQWRTRLRLHTAAGLLCEGVAVAEVGARVGYRNTSSFIVAFTDCFGQTPGRYARQNETRPLTLRP